MLWGVLQWTLLSTSFYQLVLGDCPCLATDGGALNSYRNADNTLNYQGFTYPADYGIGQCKNWDSDPSPLPPYCGDHLTGLAQDDAPDFCYDPFCYVDPNNCDKLNYPSGMFPDSGLSYSYQTCGVNGTYEEYFGDGNTGFHQLTDMADVVEEYVRSLVVNMEESMIERSFSSECSYDSMCPCTSCQTLPGWDSVDFTETGLKPFHDQTVSPLSTCLAEDASFYFSRVAGAEYRNRTAFATLYAGFQEDGVFLQWPNSQFCSSSYDPRFRPWYAAATTNPKLVVLVIDVSASMNTDNRIGLARNAALAVVDTLTENDLLSIITFNGNVRDVMDPLFMSESNVTVANAFVNSKVRASGTTNFVAPLERAQEVVNTHSFCDSVILFLTDGEAEFTEEDFENTHRAASATDTPIFTYALGTGADETVTHRLACENQGIHYNVADNADLAGVMSGYYEYFAAAINTTVPRWVLYHDFATGTELLSSCSAFYDNTDPSALTSVVAGVVCMDINIIEGVNLLRQQANFSQLIDRVMEPTRRCIPRWGNTEETGAAIESVRARNVNSGATLCNPSSSSSNSGTDVVMIIGISVGVGALCIIACLYKACSGTSKSDSSNQQTAPSTEMPRAAPSAPPVAPPAYAPADPYATQPHLQPQAQQAMYMQIPQHQGLPPTTYGQQVPVSMPLGYSAVPVTSQVNPHQVQVAYVDSNVAL